VYGHIAYQVTAECFERRFLRNTTMNCNATFGVVRQPYAEAELAISGVLTAPVADAAAAQACCAYEQEDSKAAEAGTSGNMANSKAADAQGFANDVAQSIPCRQDSNKLTREMKQPLKLFFGLVSLGELSAKSELNQV
jgi:hypothetical protein